MWDNIKVDAPPGFSPCLQPQALPVTCVSDALIGTRQVRIGSRPSPSNYDFIQQVTDRCRKEDRPIQILTKWGACKGYNQFTVRCTDFLDLMGLRRLACLQLNVQRFHPPGIRVTLFWEDFTEHVLNGDWGDGYEQSFRQLINHVNLDFVSVVRESSCVKDEDFQSLAEFYAWNLLKGNTAAIGWQGEIPWDHYIKRAQTEYPDKNIDFLKEKVALYLGLSLARYTRKVLPKRDLILSFTPYPGNVPDSFRRGRLEYKVKESKHSHKVAEPWTSFAVITDHGKNWSRVSVRDVRRNRYKVDSLRVNDVPLPILVRSA